MRFVLKEVISHGKKSKKDKKCTKKVLSLFSNFKDFNAKTDEFHVDQLKNLVDVIYQNATSKQLNLLLAKKISNLKVNLRVKPTKGKSFRTTF